MYRELIETALLALIIYAGVRLFILPYEVEGASMNPNLENNERLLVSRQAYIHFDVNDVFGFLPGVDGDHVIYPFGQPARGDVIVFHPPNGSDKPYVKRIIGLPGDRITFRDGGVYLNGQLLDESYIDGPITTCREPQHKVCDSGVILEGYVFVLGDNRQHSMDSRDFGLVDVDSIIGQAVFANWPLDQIGPVDGGDYDG